MTSDLLVALLPTLLIWLVPAANWLFLCHLAIFQATPLHVGSSIKQVLQVLYNISVIMLNYLVPVQCVNVDLTWPAADTAPPTSSCLAPRPCVLVVRFAIQCEISWGRSFQSFHIRLRLSTEVEAHYIACCEQAGHKWNLLPLCRPLFNNEIKSFWPTNCTLWKIM